MTKKCVYCRTDVPENSGVWGPKMFDAIKKNMEDARERGDINQGSVGM